MDKKDEAVLDQIIHCPDQVSPELVRRLIKHLQGKDYTKALHGIKKNAEKKPVDISLFDDDQPGSGRLPARPEID